VNIYCSNGDLKKMQKGKERVIIGPTILGEGGGKKGEGNTRRGKVEGR